MPATTIMTPNGPVLVARSCDGCTLCCRVMEATTINKPQGVICEYCDVGLGCGIHTKRPDECRDFFCGWLLDGSLGEEWRPETSHIIITYDLDGHRLNANADPLFPDAWKREPYLSQLKAWAAKALTRNCQVIAYVGRHTYPILPDRYVDLGVFTNDDYVYFKQIADGVWDAIKVGPAEAEFIRKTDPNLFC
jgi:hypothetical protein